MDEVRNGDSCGIAVSRAVTRFYLVCMWSRISMCMALPQCHTISATSAKLSLATCGIEDLDVVLYKYGGVWGRIVVVLRT